MSKEIIKPCPFCNSEAKLKTTEDNSDYCYENGKIIEYYDIQCTNKACYLSWGADWNLRNREDIIKMWNTRNKKESRDKILNDLGI
jgi:hypothetical protein